ncbi:hypothetical protein PAMP_010771 [Pampus punctatissimus]
MTDSVDTESVPCFSDLSSGAGPSFQAGRGLPGRVRSVSSPAPHGRLTSLRSRDLTLGGAFKKPKKTFEPNVHAMRKNKDELKEEVHVAPKKERREKEERRRENRGRRREKPQMIQSHSIFEQGPADTVRKTGWLGASDLSDSTTSPVCKLVKKERKESEEDEDDILRKLQRDDFINDPGLRNDAKLKPIQLPLCQSSSFMKSQPLTCEKTPSHYMSDTSYGTNVFALLCSVCYCHDGRSSEAFPFQTSVLCSSEYSRPQQDTATQIRAAVPSRTAPGSQPVWERGALLHAVTRLYARQSIW